MEDAKLENLKEEFYIERITKAMFIAITLNFQAANYRRNIKIENKLNYVQIFKIFS